MVTIGAAETAGRLRSWVLKVITKGSEKGWQDGQASLGSKSKTVEVE